MKKIGRNLFLWLCVAALLAGCIRQPNEQEADLAAKPVIYLYPETETEVTVQLDYAGDLTVTYPTYSMNGWTVTAQPDGTLYDAQGHPYSYLFWEGISDTDWDFSQGFCVAGADTAPFLQQALAQLGLTPREYNEMIVYWLPRMQQAPYNLIAFQTDRYTQTARLTVTPKPDAMLRVFMAYRPLAQPVDISPQILTPTVRTGFTVVEWGGVCVS